METESVIPLRFFFFLVLHTSRTVREKFKAIVRQADKTLAAEFYGEGKSYW